MLFFIGCNQHHAKFSFPAASSKWYFTIPRSILVPSRRILTMPAVFSCRRQIPLPASVSPAYPALRFVQPFEPLYHIQNGKAQWERKSRPFTGLAARRSGFLLGAGPYGIPVGKADGAITVHIQADHGAGEPLTALQPLAGKVGRLGNRPERLPRATVFHGKAACALPCRNAQPDFFRGGQWCNLGRDYFIPGVFLQQ